MTTLPLTIDEALTDKRLLGAALSDFDLCTWLPLLKAVFGLDLDDEEAKTLAEIAGNRGAPKSRVRELWAVVGRRGGKSRMAAAVAIYLALFVKHKLSVGETGMVLILAASQVQARAVFDYIRGFLDASPVLSKEISGDPKKTEIVLKNGIVIAVHSNSFRTVRGRTLVACIMDECSFWRDETSANPDIETYRAVLPSLATTKGLLIGISSPYRKVGLLYQKHRDHFGKDDDNILVVQGDTRTFNPILDEEEILRQKAADPGGADTEWDAEFRTDLASFLDDATIDFAIEHGRPIELPPRSIGFYRAFIDASGGVGGDSYTIAIAHKERHSGKESFVVDLVRGTTGKFDPDIVTQQYAELCKQYRISTVHGDYYGAEWVSSAWRRTGVAYVKSDLMKSKIYLECLPLFTRGMVRLPDHPKLIKELRLLERTCHSGGRESVEHPKRGHDDYANAVCGALRLMANRVGYDPSYRAFQPGFVDEDAPPPNGQQSPANERLADLYAGIDAAFRLGIPR